MLTLESLEPRGKDLGPRNSIVVRECLTPAGKSIIAPCLSGSPQSSFIGPNSIIYTIEFSKRKALREEYPGNPQKRVPPCLEY